VSEAAWKRLLALESAGPFQTSDPADVRWLLCGRARPVAAGTSQYAVRVTGTQARVLYQDIESSRIAADERWEELGYEPASYPWHGLPPPDFSALRRSLSPEELERYRYAGRDAAEAFVEALDILRPESRGSTPRRSSPGACTRATSPRRCCSPAAKLGHPYTGTHHRRPSRSDASHFSPSRPSATAFTSR
jgi:hypothetical protein